MTTTPTATDPAAIVGRAFELAAEADAEADAYARQRAESYRENITNGALDALEDILPDLAAHAAITVCEHADGPDAIVIVGDPDAPLVRLEGFENGMCEWSFYLAMPCPACSACPVRGPMVDTLTTLGIALRSEVPEHDTGPVYVPEFDATIDGRCDGHTVTFTPPAPPVEPAPLWRTERINTPIDLEERCTMLEAAGYEVLWPPLMDGHVIAARLRS